MTPKGWVLDLLIDKKGSALLYIMNADPFFYEDPQNESHSLKHFIDSSHKVFHNGG